MRRKTEKDGEEKRRGALSQQGGAGVSFLTLPSSAEFISLIAGI